VSDEDITRAETAICAGEDRHDVFLRLDELTTQVDGAGLTVTVLFTKKQGAPVRYVSDTGIPAAAVRKGRPAAQVSPLGNSPARPAGPGRSARDAVEAG
jgi:hypothetical protein